MENSRTSTDRTDSTQPGSLTPRGADLDPGSPRLPRGSSQFQEVLAELHPSSSPSPPPSRSPSPQRRRHTVARVRFVHRGSKDLKGKGIKNDFVSTKEEEEEEEEETGETDRQIFHGKCHCYFVENGNVTGLADRQCHHEHRSYPSSPSSSPSPGRFLPRSPSSSPRIHRKAPLTLTPEGSPKLRSKLHVQSHTHLLLPRLHLEEFRERANSDTTVMARLSSSKKTRSPTTTTTITTSAASSDPQLSKMTPQASPTISVDRPSSARRSTSPRNANGDLALSDKASVPPKLSMQMGGSFSPSSSLSHKRDGGASKDRKMSQKAVSSDQLHYLYDQLSLQVPAGHGGEGRGGGALAQRPYSARASARY